MDHVMAGAGTNEGPACEFRNEHKTSQWLCICRYEKPHKSYGNKAYKGMQNTDFVNVH